MGFLDGLEKLSWQDLFHAYGPATDVPGLLRALADPNRATEEVRKRAVQGHKSIREHVISELWGNVHHQGTVWSVTPHTVPFLLEILRDGPRDAELHHFLITYLHHL